jgi:transcriptional regulator with XRE-family HTH domain
LEWARTNRRYNKFRREEFAIPGEGTVNEVEDGMDAVEESSDGVESPALIMFAAELRSWRKHLGWTQAETGDRIGYSDKLVSAIERRWRTPTLDFARACDREMGAPGTFERRWEDISKESFPPWFALVPILESKAKKIHEWDMRCLPGLLQTEDYARSIIRANRPNEADDVIERDVTARMRRQDVLKREHLLSAWFIICESVLRRVFGGPEVMRAQLDNLIEIGALPGITIQILPSSAPDYAGAGGPMTIFELPDGHRAVYVEGCKVGRVIEAPDDVDSLTTRFDLLRASALSRGDSIRLMRKIRSEYGESTP